MNGTRIIDITRVRETGLIVAICSACGQTASATQERMVMDRLHGINPNGQAVNIALSEGTFRAECTQCNTQGAATNYDFLMKEAADNPHLRAMIEGWV